MAENLVLDVVTPEETLISQQVNQVVVPGVDGEFGVLVNHAPLIAALRPGVVRVLDGSGKIEKRILVSGGFVEVTSERCTVLATIAHDFDKVDRAELEKRLSTIKKIHDEAIDEREKQIALKEVDISQEIFDAFIFELDHHK